MIQLFSGTKWKIITLLASKNRTQTELAKALGISAPTLQTHLSHLREKGLIRKAGEKKGKTRPYIEYSIGDGFVFFVKAVPNEAEQKMMKVDDDLLLHLRIWSIPQREFQLPIEKFWWEIKEHVKDIGAIAVFGSVAEGTAKKGSDVDVLIIADKNTAELEKKFGAKMYEGKMLMAQVFTKEDFLNSGMFFKQVEKNMKIIYNPENILKN